MKHLIIAAAVLAATFAKAETITVVERNAEGVLVTNAVDALEYANELVSRKAASKAPDAYTQPHYHLTGRTTEPSVIAAVDDLLSRNRFYVPGGTKYPKMAANYAKVYEETIPELVPVTKLVVDDPVRKDARVITSLVSVYAQLKTHHLINDNGVRTILNAAPIAIRHAIRASGKSFVEKDGVNPVQIRIDRISAALNAPRIAGLDAAFRENGMDYGLTFASCLLPDAEIETLRTDVLNGDRQFSSGTGFILRTHLGIEAYNAFVKLYNEGE